MRNVASRSSQHSKMLGQPGLLADRVQALGLHQGLERGVLRTHLRPGLDPLGLALDRASRRCAPRDAAACVPSGTGAGVTSAQHYAAGQRLRHRRASTTGNLDGYLLRVDVFAALADPVRRSLLDEVAAGPAGSSTWPPAARSPGPPSASTCKAARRRRAGDRRPTTAASATTPWSRQRWRRSAPCVERLVLGGTPVTAHALDALDTEVRRTGRDRRTSPTSRQETA